MNNWTELNNGFDLLEDRAISLLDLVQQGADPTTAFDLLGNTISEMADFGHAVANQYSATATIMENANGLVKDLAIMNEQLTTRLSNEVSARRVAELDAMIQHGRVLKFSVAARRQKRAIAKEIAELGFNNPGSKTQHMRHVPDKRKKKITHIML